MKRLWIFPAIFVLLLMTCAGIFVLSQPPVPPPSYPSPDFTWTDFNGGQHMLSELEGQPVVLHFWASWCAPCKVELPELYETAARTHKVTFLLITADTDKEAAQRFLQEIEMEGAPENIRHAFDPTRIITYDTFQTIQFPETIILDREHNMVRKFSGPVAWKNIEITAFLTRL